MTQRERFNETMNFGKPEGRGSVMETFYPWGDVLLLWDKEGFDDTELTKHYPRYFDKPETERYINSAVACMNYEIKLGFDPLLRVAVNLPLLDCLNGKKIEAAQQWEELKIETKKKIAELITREDIIKGFSPFVEDAVSGKVSTRLNFSGFFWMPRDLFGIEEHLYAFYDFPELMHDMNKWILEKYLEIFDVLFEVLPFDLAYIQEDLSGATGPMISKAHFDEFVAPYYNILIPYLKSKGVGHIFVDTDGDFTSLIDNFLACGVEGFLPLDVNAGVDVVEIRKNYPKIKCIGAFNKLCILAGKEAIDAEFERLLPVIRQGGYIPGSDHQLAPGTTLENYRYYISRLHEVMKQSCTMTHK